MHKYSAVSKSIALLYLYVFIDYILCHYVVKKKIEILKYSTLLGVLSMPWSFKGGVCIRDGIF